MREIISSSCLMPLVWWHYIDDIFMHSSNPTPSLFYKEGVLIPSNLVIRVEMKDFFSKGRCWTKGGLLRKGGFFTLTQNFH